VVAVGALGALGALVQGTGSSVLVVTVLAVLVVGGLVAAVLAVVLTRQQRAGLDTLLQVAGEQLDARVRSGAASLESRKELIDAELGRVAGTLEQLAGLVDRVERDRAGQLGQLGEQLQGVSRTHTELARTTGALREALASPSTRGQWGERLAEDVLRAAGFQPGVNYVTQRTLPGGGRPDVTFLLPDDLVLHMDVKFPLRNHLAVVEATSEAQRTAARAAFLRDVRARVKELLDRGYVDPAGGTLDCVLLFLPNDGIVAELQQRAPQLFDEALAAGVVVCSPSSLFAILAVLRRSIDSVHLARTSDEILGLLGGFTAQWGRYVEEVDRLGKQLDTVRRTHDGLTGPRRRQLERQLDAIEDLRARREVAPVVRGERSRLRGVDDATPGADEASA
jgi:DNA recombination protein RmuC